jgi:CubicO group peptidase (beta-lactamase class C family)
MRRKREVGDDGEVEVSKSRPRWILQIGFLVLVGLLAGCHRPEVNVPPPPVVLEPMQLFEQEIQNLRKTLRIPGMSVAILKEQEIVFKKGFGYADIQNQIPATENTPYNLASLTKPFAATVLMCLVEEGKLNLDQALSGILKDSEFHYQGYSANGYMELCNKIRKLAWRYSSIWDYRCHTEKISVKHHLTHTSQGVPGANYKYNGFLFSFLANVAEEASGKAFNELLVEKIIAPLEMTSTVPSIHEGLRRETLTQRAKYYQLGVFGALIPSKKNPYELSASAGMVSTVIDLAKFDVAMDQNRIISGESKKTMFTRTISNSGKRLPYGLGWFVQEYRGAKIVWHYGHAPEAYSSLIVKMPAKELTMILLANSDGASRGFNLGKGDLLNSPFASLFINHFTNIKRMR